MTTGFDRDALESAEPVFVHLCPARFQDIDAAGFLFFARAYDYFHDAWLAFMEHRGMPLDQSRAWGAPLKRSFAEYLAPIRFGDKLEIGLCKAEWRGSNLTIGYRACIRGGRVAVVGYTQHVVVDMATMTRIPPPADLRSVFTPLEGACETAG